MQRTLTFVFLALAAFTVAFAVSFAQVGLPPTRDSNHPRRPLEVGHPTFASPHAFPIAVAGKHVLVVNTPSDTVDVIDTMTLRIVKRIPVGIDPVSLAVRPDGKEIWVANHVSDSVNVIDNEADSPTYLQIVATIQEFDGRTKATTFDEPIAIAFAGNEKAYVALSSENQIAVIDVPSRSITKRLRIPAQDPRAIVVRGNRLYVLPFESNNKSQLSGGSRDDIDGELVTFDAWEHSIRVNNVLSLGHVTDIVKHPDVPDRDLFIYDTETDELIKSVDSLGTLLYGIAVDSHGSAFIAQTDARNDANGRAGTKKHGMKELENRAFLNRITKVTTTDGEAVDVQFFDLEPVPPEQPGNGAALATPYAVAITPDDETIIGVAAGSDKLFTLDAQSGKVLGRVPVGTVPRGIALENTVDGKPVRAWVYNAVADTVSVIDISDRAHPKVAGFVKLEDPTDRRIKLGRTWFNDADASTTGTFSCESCHPDNNTDQLLWVLKTPIVTGGNQIMPRSTMPVRGLRDTEPFHWDGTLGDPYGGNNSAHIYESVPPTADPSDPTTATRHLVDASLEGVLRADWDEVVNDEGKPGRLTAAERDDLALYLLNVPFPPAQRRAYDNVLTETAQRGFKLFHIDGDLDPSRRRPNVCGNCHRMPFWVSTNTPGTGMDAPTWRGAYDRFLILPQGRLNIIEFPFYRRVAERGLPEEQIWRFSWGGRPRFNPVWKMVLEGSTGFSGAFGRQVTLNKETVDRELTADLLGALETAATEGGIVLEADGVLIEDGKPQELHVQYDPTYRGGTYVSKNSERNAYESATLMNLARASKLVATVTGRHGARVGPDHPQPAIWTLGPIHEQRGRQRFPILYPGALTITLSGRHFDDKAAIYVDGRRARGTVQISGDENDRVSIRLATLPKPGIHFLQVQAEHGMFSNDFIFHVAPTAEAARELRRTLDAPHVDQQEALFRAIERGEVRRVKQLLVSLADRVNDRRPSTGSTPLSEAAFRGRVEIVKLLLDSGADVNATNRDGNTPLIAAAFMCRFDIVRLLLERGASVAHQNVRGETVIDIMTQPWSDELATFYRAISRGTGVATDLEQLKQDRPKMAELLKQHATK